MPMIRIQLKLLTLSLLLGLVFLTPAQAETIDDFESYLDTSDLQAFWSFANALDTTTPNHDVGSQSLRREGFTNGPGSGMIVLRTFSPPLDLSTALGLSAWIRRDPASVDTVRFAIFARDADDLSCAPQGVPFISDSEWHRTYLDFAEFCDAIDLTRVATISFNVSNQSTGPGDVQANFDDLEVDFGDLFFDGFESGDLTLWAQVVP